MTDYFWQFVLKFNLHVFEARIYSSNCFKLSLISCFLKYSIWKKKNISTFVLKIIPNRKILYFIWIHDEIFFQIDIINSWEKSIIHNRIPLTNILEKKFFFKNSLKGIFPHSCKHLSLISCSGISVGSKFIEKTRKLVSDCVVSAEK